MEETVLHLIIGFQKYAAMNRKNPHESLHYCFQLFVQECNKHGVIPPKNYQEFIEVLQLPASDWGIDSIAHYYPAHIPLIDKYLRPLPQTAEIIYSIDENIDQFSTEQINNHLHQVHMRNLLSYCYEHELDDVYRKIRLFLINPEHAVISALHLTAFKNEFTDGKLIDLIDALYEPVPHIENYYQCPYCQWTLVFDEYEDKLVCNHSSPCHERANLQHGLPFVERGDSLRYYRLKPGIQRFTLIPGISENRLRLQLEKKGYEVLMYPNIDEYDLHASRGLVQLKIDTKDYLSPFSLAKKLLASMEKEGWDEKLLYVIPYERYAKNRHYIEEVYRVVGHFLEEAENPYLEARARKLKIIDERALLKKVGDRSDVAVIAAINSLDSHAIQSY